MARGGSTATGPFVLYRRCADGSQAPSSERCGQKESAAGLANVPSRVGAVCVDGSQSGATGSGACSYHGGVARWLYDQPPPTLWPAPTAVYASSSGPLTKAEAAQAYTVLQADTDSRVTNVCQPQPPFTTSPQVCALAIAKVIDDAVQREMQIPYPESMSNDASQLVAAAQGEEDAYNAAAQASDPSTLQARINAATDVYRTAAAAIQRDLGIASVP